jgi:hypothetical protein
LNGAPTQSAGALAAFDNLIQLCHPATGATYNSGVIELLNQNAHPGR